MFACEPLHDIPNHIKQLLDELKGILNGESLDVLNECVEFFIKKKSNARGCDYVEALMILTHWLHGRCNEDEYNLLETLCEISRLARMKAQKRCVRSELRLHNVTYKHAILLKKVIPSPRNAAFCKMYAHAITCEMPLTYRLIPISSLSAENHEKVFNTLKNTATNSSSRKVGSNPGDVEPNSFIRIQAKSR